MDRNKFTVTLLLLLQAISALFLWTLGATAGRSVVFVLFTCVVMFIYEFWFVLLLAVRSDSVIDVPLMIALL